jgi:hypothetical protein
MGIFHFFEVSHNKKTTDFQKEIAIADILGVD